MKSKILIALFFSFWGLTINISAQENKQEKPKPLQSSMDGKKIKSVARLSQYNHKETEILARLNTDVIPDDFPKFKPSYTQEQYNLLMNSWYKNNGSFLKKETNTNSEK